MPTDPPTSTTPKNKTGFSLIAAMLAPVALILLASCNSPGTSRAAIDQQNRVQRIVEDASAKKQEAKPSILISREEIEELEGAAEDPLFQQPESQDLSPIRLTLRELWSEALTHSPQIQVFADLPLIRRTGIQEARGIFDVRAFAEIAYADRDDPVGSELDTGRTGRFLEKETLMSAGLDKRFSPGTEVYVRQEFNRLKNNSEFTIPNPQWESRSVVGIRQPLLQGAGTAYNRGIVEVAKLDAEISEREFERQVEAHLVEISRSYWSLYMAKGIAEAKRRSLQEALDILEELEARRDLDSGQSQIAQAQAYAASRQASLVRSETTVLNASERLRTLVFGPEMMEGELLQLIPADPPDLSFVPLNYEDALREAIQSRPEVLQAYLQVEAAVIRREISANELRANLSAFAEGYLAGLSGEDYDEAWNDQYDYGPGYMVGLRLEMPIGNNTAKAVNQRRRLEQRQLERQLLTTVQTVQMDVRISMREVEASYRDMAAKYVSLRAAREDLRNIVGRKDEKLLGGEGDPVTELALLLGTQERLLNAEENFLMAVATYNVALDSLERAKGTLLDQAGIEILEDDVEWEERRLIFEENTLPAIIPAMDSQGDSSPGTQ